MKQRLKSIVYLCFLGLFFFSPSFADSAADLEETTDLIANIMMFLAWTWSLFAIIAGKLMTNDLLTGGLFQLDTQLRKMRNVMKNFANFALGFYLVFSVIKSLVSSQGDETFKMFGKIKGFLLAGILIQSSRFMTNVVIDLSTILTSAVGSLPSIYISESSSYQNTLKSLYGDQTERKKFTFSTEDDGSWTMTPTTIVSDPIDDKELFDYLTPNANTVAGPLLFIGSSILKLHSVTLHAPETYHSGKVAFMTVVMNIAVILMYSIAMIILIVVNVVRVGFIRLLMAAGPIFALLRGLERGGVLEKSPLETDKLKASTIIELIFIPVRAVLCLGLVLIFVTSMRSILVQNNGTVEQMATDYDAIITNGQDESSFAISNVMSNTLEGEIFHNLGDQVQSTFADIILFIVTIVLIWILIKQCFPKENAIVGKTTQKMFELGETLMGSAPIIPVPGGGGKLSVNSIGELRDRSQRKAVETVFGEGATLRELDRLGKDQMHQGIENAMGIKKTHLTGAEEKMLFRATESGTNYSSYLSTLGDVIGGYKDEGTNLLSGKMGTYFHRWMLEQSKNSNGIFRKGGEANLGGIDITENKDETLKAYFGKERNKKRLLKTLASNGIVSAGTRISETSTYNDRKNTKFRAGAEVDSTDQTEKKAE